MMEETAITALPLAGDQAVGFGVWALIADADPVVKAVLLILLLASLWSWTVIFDKALRYARLRRRSRAFERAFWSGAPLDDLYLRLGTGADHPMAMLFAAAMEEWRDAPRPSAPAEQSGLLQRIGKIMGLTLERELETLGRHLSSLATIGATAPFVGLFGTVWGIINSFQSIALTKNTTLAVVAPGIAEALFATALGLVAAVPAVVAYNKLSGDLDRFANQASNFADEFAVVLSRELESGQTVGRGGSRAA
ncbi:MAG TPA: protein TolQ [Geminicoccaceae bacterium]|nr:protein TolQ [Geminicoccaceae bacterium]